MRRTVMFIGMLGILVVSVACGPLGENVTVGSGNVKTETRQVSGFNALEFSGFGEMTIQQTGTESLSVTAEDNILPLITTTVSGQTLRIGGPSGQIIRPTRSVTYALTVKDLKALTLSGAGNITVSGIQTDALRVVLSGAGKLTVSGTAPRQEVTLSGTGAYEAGDLTSNTASVTVSGAGRARVNVRDTLDATVSGVGSIVYLGDPAVTQHVTGAGSVTKG
ncbi:MAG TPA: head GIN domain-containing protein [Ktedonobacterales bacterium]|nr:head GIN domain-containing protein [Ktedonobacterales bacterium]